MIGSFDRSIDGELPEEWRAYQRRDRRRESVRKVAQHRHKRQRFTHHKLAWVIMLAAGVWIHACGPSGVSMQHLEWLRNGPVDRLAAARHAGCAAAGAAFL